MKLLWKIFGAIVLIILLTITLKCAFAQETNETIEVVEPEVSVGITPDSSFYFLDQMFSMFKNKEKLAMERAVEARLMHQKNNTKAEQKALAGYAKTIEKIRQVTPEKYERVLNQTSKHIANMERVMAQVSEQARFSIEKNLNKSIGQQTQKLERMNVTNETKQKEQVKPEISKTSNKPEEIGKVVINETSKKSISGSKGNEFETV